MNPYADVLRVTFDGDPSFDTNLLDFAHANEENPEIVAEVAALQPGQSATFGGGSSPGVTVVRL